MDLCSSKSTVVAARTQSTQASPKRVALVNPPQRTVSGTNYAIQILSYSKRRGYMILGR